MKLLTRTTRTFLLASLLATAVSGLLCYGFLTHIMDEEASEQLQHIKTRLTDYVQTQGHLPAKTWIPTLEHLLISPARQPVAEQLSDTLLYNDLEKGLINYRQLTFGLVVSGQHYQVIIQKPLLEMEDLTEALLLGFAGLLVCLIGTLSVVNYRIAHRLWQPFYQTLDMVASFQSRQATPLVFTPTNTTEFSQLQTQLMQLTEQVRRDFQSLKTFTENASHELQTPLAIIRTKLENLLQDETLTAPQSHQISALLEAVGRLTKLNQTLLLLAKIENRQFTAVESLALSELITHKLDFMSEWIGHKQLQLSLNLNPSVRVVMNPYLADVLLNNILSNAIKHNPVGGQLSVLLTASGLTVSNTGEALTQAPEQLRERFQKNDTTSDSPGLGLAIIDEIGRTYGFPVQYQFAMGWHYLTIDWPGTN